MDLEPTFSCFDDALELIEQRLREEPAALDRLRLVHALCEGDTGALYAHAWVEEGGLCWDAALAEGQKVWYSVRRFNYYKAKRVRTRTVYTMRDVWEHNTRTGTYGPWESPYLEYVGNGSNRIVGRARATYRPRR